MSNRRGYVKPSHREKDKAGYINCRVKFEQSCYSPLRRQARKLIQDLLDRGLLWVPQVEREWTEMKAFRLWNIEVIFVAEGEFDKVVEEAEGICWFEPKFFQREKLAGRIEVPSLEQQRISPMHPIFQQR